MAENKNPIFSDDEFDSGTEVVKDKDESTPEVGVKPSKFRVIVWGVVALFVLLGLLFIGIMVAGHYWLYGEEDTGPKANAVAAVDPLIAQREREEAERVRIGALNDIQRAQERIDTLEGYIKQIVGTLENSDIQTIMSELDREKRERLTTQSLLEQMLDENSAMRRLIDDLNARLSEVQTLAMRPVSIDYAPPPEVEEYKEEIPISTSPTTFLNNLGQLTAENQQKAQEAEEAAEAATAEYDNRPGIPVAGLVKAVLTTRIVSTQNLSNFFVQAQTLEDVEVAKGYWLPRGAVFYGKAMPDMTTRRIGITIEGVRVGHIQYPMNGVLLDKFGAPGIVSKYVDPFWRDMWLSLIPQLGATFAIDGDAESTTTETTDANGETSTKTTENTRNSMIKNMATNLVNQIAEHSKQQTPIIIVDSGLPVIVQFTEKLPLDVLIRGGGMAVADGRRFPQDNPFAVPREETVTVGPNAQRILGWNGPVSDGDSRRAYQGRNPKTTTGIRGLWMGSYSDPNEKTPVSKKKGADMMYIDDTPTTRQKRERERMERGTSSGREGSDPIVREIYGIKAKSSKKNGNSNFTNTSRSSPKSKTKRKTVTYNLGNDR